ncbi:hypothetical protein N7463_003999 [Penicillium fimorum]|uniref:Uncharacterized protein n=1 Tax=Penicillium fimorum TaxID=1882269 RepID=A0A9W9Y232_9EURO|nr:hypothetical protein N7463_003999 [Penicillium fimorum]
MAARTLDRMRKAQSLIRECHSWASPLVENDEILLAVELCQIEGELALFFENRCFANSSCPGLLDEQPPHRPPFNGHRRGTCRQPYIGDHRPPQINRSRTEAPASRAGGGQNAQVQAAITSRGKMGEASSPTGVLLDFDDDVKLVQLPPNMVADMDAANSTDVGSKEKQPLPEGSAAGSSDEPALGDFPRVDNDDRSLHQTVTTVADTISASLNYSIDGHCPPLAVEEGVTTVLSPCEPQLPGSPACGSPEDELPRTSQTYQRVNGPTESQKGSSNEEFRCVEPTDIESTTHIEEKDSLAGGVDSRACHNLQTEDSEDDELVFQGNEANSICPDFKALFVSSDDDSQPICRAINLKAIFEKYSEVIICK